MPHWGLYAITDSRLTPPPDLEAAVAGALRGGAALVQYRDKSADTRLRQRQAAALVRLCHAHGVPLIVNDDPRLALEVGADGVHLGQEDKSVAEATALLGPGAIIGVSCYGQVERARRAVAEGADYVAFGRFFPSATKPQAIQADPGLLAKARREFTLPLVAIGGITPENAPVLLRAGAGLLAVIEGVFGHPDPEAAATAYARLFSEHDDIPRNTP